MTEMIHMLPKTRADKKLSVLQIRKHVGVT